MRVASIIYVIFIGLQRLLVGLISLGLHLGISAYYPIGTIYKLDFVQSTTMVQRGLFTYLALVGERWKYYFAWKVAEGASIIAGFGFKGSKVIGGKIVHDWTGVENIDIIAWETSANVQGLSKHWNKRTQGWLQRYTYDRHNQNLFLTYFISAFWHGLYPGIYTVDTIYTTLHLIFIRLCTWSLPRLFLILHVGGSYDRNRKTQSGQAEPYLLSYV